MRILISVALTLAFYSCKKEVMPKPRSFLRLEYPQANYITFSNHCRYTFYYNTMASVHDEQHCNFNIEYPTMKATIYLNYKPVLNNIEILLRDAQKLTYEHVIRADNILEQPYINVENKVYGMFYKVGGNAASQVQFYVTDSVRNFVVGSVYFYVKPNYDSILPAASYLEHDVRFLIESLRWK